MNIQSEAPPRQRRSSRQVDKISYIELARDLETESRLEMRELSDLAWVFLLATNNDSRAAADLLDRSIDLICDGGLLQMWRYRIVLEKIREGL
jgi:hypothetical protein